METESRADGPSKRHRKIKLLSLDDLDGRFRSVQQIHATRQEILSDLGGVEQLSVLERLAVDNCAVINGMVQDIGARWMRGEQVNPTDVGTLMNVFNRSAAALGWQRRSRDVTPDLSHIHRRTLGREGKRQ